MRCPSRADFVKMPMISGRDARPFAPRTRFFAAIPSLPDREIRRCRGSPVMSSTDRSRARRSNFSIRKNKGMTTLPKTKRARAGFSIEPGNASPKRKKGHRERWPDHGGCKRNDWRNSCIEPLSHVVFRRLTGGRRFHGLRHGQPFDVIAAHPIALGHGGA